MRNLGVIRNNGLSCALNITAVARSCRFALLNIPKIWSFLTRDPWSKHWSSPAWTAVNPSWLYPQPLRLTRCSISRMLQRTSFTIYSNSPMWPPSNVTSTGFLLQPHQIQYDDVGLQGHQWNCTLLPPNTCQTTRPSMSTSLYYILWSAGADTRGR